MLKTLTIGIGLPVLALALQRALWPWVHPFIWFMFYPAVYISARIGGFRSGIISTALSVLLVWLFFHLTTGAEPPSEQNTLYSAIIFLVMGIVISEGYARIAHSERSDLAQQVVDLDARFESIFEHAGIGIAMTGPDGKWLRVNGKMCAILGYDRQELLTTSFQAITYPDDLADDLEAVEKFEAGTLTAITKEKRYIKKDGQPVWVSLTVAVIRHPDGTPSYYIVTVEDIQSRRDMERQLADSRRRLKDILDNSSVLIGYWDKDLRSVFANHTYLDWFGIDLANMPGAHASEVLSPELYAANRPYMDAVLRGERQHFERNYPNPKGGTRNALLDFIPDIRDGEVGGVLCPSHRCDGPEERRGAVACCRP